MISEGISIKFMGSSDIFLIRIYAYSQFILDSVVRNKYIAINMKITSLVKTMSILFFVVFTLQVSGLTCIGEPLFKISGVQGEYQIKAIDSDNGGGAYSSPVNLEESHCPCHLSFSHFLSIASAYYPPSVQLSLIQKDGIPIKILTDIFHPPKALI